MGLLDDAIREHLELKQRAGADATDVARAAQEALGADPEEGSPVDRAEPDQLRHAPPESGLAPPPAFYDDEPEDETEDPHDDPPPPTAAPAPVAPTRPAAGPPTEEYRVPSGGNPQDVLEQTPDFLQETPEHDRLWFEQAPPQEFDFDK